MRALGVVRGSGAMKAFLLAAGIGSRLRPITDTIPKCMVDIDGRPLLDIWLDDSSRAGIDEVLVNLHYLPEVVREHIASRTGPPMVRLVLEPELLRQRGHTSANREWVEDESSFLCAMRTTNGFRSVSLGRRTSGRRSGRHYGGISLGNSFRRRRR